MRIQRDKNLIEEYRIEFILLGKNIAVDKLIKTLTEIGSSVTVDKEEDDKFKIHIRATDPKRVFDRTSKYGKPMYIKVNSY